MTKKQDTLGTKKLRQSETKEAQAPRTQSKLVEEKLGVKARQTRNRQHESQVKHFALSVVTPELECKWLEA